MQTLPSWTTGWRDTGLLPARPGVPHPRQPSVVSGFDTDSGPGNWKPKSKAQ